MLRVSLIAHTPEPEKVVAAAAKLCYSSAGVDDLLAGLTPEKSREFVEKLAKLGHESPTEHASFTFAIEGVSRSLLAQITRHRIASYSVQSQRYVRLDEFEYVTPPKIAADPEALDAFRQAMDRQGEEYRRIAALLKDFVLPNACDTKMIVTMNARSLHNFFKHRCCARAQWEIRALADEMLRLVYPIAPALFAMAGPSCVRGACSEGSMTCGEAAAMGKKYAELKEEALRQ